MENRILFNEKNVNRPTLLFEDLEIGSIFMYDYPEARYHFIKVKKGTPSLEDDYNAVCLEDGEFECIEEGRDVKKFFGEISLNGIFIRERD